MLTSSGQLGINTTSPSFNLDVTGNARFTSGITFPYGSSIGCYNYPVQGYMTAGYSGFDYVKLGVPGYSTTQNPNVYPITMTANTSGTYVAINQSGQPGSYNLDVSGQARISGSSGQNLTLGESAVNSSAMPSFHASWQWMANRTGCAAGQCT